MKCEHCGRSDTKENPVTKGPDPFAYEIHDDETEIWECDNCREESAMDI